MRHLFPSNSLDLFHGSSSDGSTAVEEATVRPRSLILTSHYKKDNAYFTVRMKIMVQCT